jgi:hypothetical protein
MAEVSYRIMAEVSYRIMAGHGRAIDRLFTN